MVHLGAVGQFAISISGRVVGCLERGAIESLVGHLTVQLVAFHSAMEGFVVVMTEFMVVVEEGFVVVMVEFMVVVEGFVVVLVEFMVVVEENLPDGDHRLNDISSDELR